MKVSVKVPATSANIGPGFDCLGLALPIYNTITIEETVLPGTGIEINMMTEDEEAIDEMIFDDIPRDENNIVYKAVEMLYNSIGQEPSELKINIQSQIPITRGLGSSAAVIVGGLIAANKLLGSPADETALLSIATEVEGHPDNVAPAILGGFVLASQDDGSIVYRKLNWPNEWDITVCIPDFELSTNIARSVLPTSVPLQDAVYNAKHLAMLIEAVDTKDEKLMKAALHDKLHQPYREKLVPGMKEIMEAFKHEDGILGCVLSGAGPTLLIISHKYDLDKIKSTVKEIWEPQSVRVDIRTLKVEQNGAEILE